jgi:hypothetical protein
LSVQEAGVAREFFQADKGWVRIVERRLWHEFSRSIDTPKTGTLKTSGRFDVALVHPRSRRALICDGKSGWLDVTPSPSNLQLRRLAVLLWLRMDPREIGVSILKPFGQTDHPTSYTVSDLERSLDELEQDVRQCHAIDPPRTAGEEQCRYCRARESCPTRLAWLTGALPPAWPSLPLSSARDWTPHQRAQFLECEKDARDWLQARKEEIKFLLAEKSDAVPGYELKPGRRIETITDPAQVLKRFCNGLGGTFERFMYCVKVGKGALQEEVRALRAQRGKALQAEMGKLLADCVEIKSSAPSIEKLK